MNDLSYFLRVAGSLDTVPIVFVQLLRNVTRGLSCLDIPAPISVACPCGSQFQRDSGISKTVPAIRAGRKKSEKEIK